VLATVAAIVAGMILLAWCNKQKTDAENAAYHAEQNRRLASELAAQKLKKEAEDKLRAACGVAADAPIYEAFAIRTQCQESVRPHLKAPGSADFPGLLDSDGTPFSMDGCVTIYNSWVDSLNSFGAKLRQEYACTYDPRTGRTSIEFR
jgi:hypothetical protein